MSTSGSGLKSIIPPTLQADATINQANPVSGTLYEVLATITNVRIIHIAVWVTWTVQPTPLECHVTIDGITRTYAFTDPVSATYYYPTILSPNAETDQQMNSDMDVSLRTTYPIEGKSVRIQVETTGGTVQGLAARVKYAKW